MPDNVYAFSQHIGTLCVTHDTNVHKLGAKLGFDPGELLRMINGKVVPTRAVIQGLAKALDSDPSYLEKLVEEIRKDLGK
jgi:transcriptional regulator with XRE-family HTH domain